MLLQGTQNGITNLRVTKKKRKYKIGMTWKVLQTKRKYWFSVLKVERINERAGIKVRVEKVV
jgi:hypothetical protein